MKKSRGARFRFLSKDAPVTKRILCLIIDGVPREAWRTTYAVHRNNWKKCLELCPEIEGYFLYSDPALKSPCTVEGCRFTVRGEERYDTIFRKSVMGVKKLLDDHDYVIRTNLSSLWDFPLLLRQSFPKTGVYTGHAIPCYQTFVSGSGMLMSRDVAETLVAPTTLTLAPQDDIAIAQVLGAHGIRPQHRSMFIYDYSRGVDQLSIGEYIQYRLREENDPERKQERAVAMHLFATIYGAS